MTKTTMQQVSDKPLVNRVAQSKLVTIDLEKFGPGEIAAFDLKEHLWQGLVLKEADFRAMLNEYYWAQYAEKHVIVTCSTDAIIPTWAYLLVTAKLQPWALEVFAGTHEEFLLAWYRRVLDQLDYEQYRDGLLVIKGCSTTKVPLSAYSDLMSRLVPIARSIMFGEPCSTVPVYKRPKK